MKLVVSATIAAAILSACGTYITPVQPTGNKGEYVVSVQHNYSVASSLPEAIRLAEEKAQEACGKMGKVFHKNYSLDKQLANSQPPESTLYFTCVDPK